MAAVLARAFVGERVACDLAETERIVKFAIGQQSSIGSDRRPSELKRQSAVEIELENPVFWFTRWVCHRYLARSGIRCLNRRERCVNQCVIR
jgi:hypothetical protein